MSAVGIENGLHKRLKKRSTVVIAALNLLLYYFLLRWASENIDLEKFAGYFKQISAWVLIISVALKFLLLAVYGARMALLLKSNFRTAFFVINIGAALNTLLPFRLGEALKIYLSHKLLMTSVPGIFVGAIAEKLIDVCVVLFLCGAIVIFSAGDTIRGTLLLVVGTMTVVGISGITLARRNIVRIVKILPKNGLTRRIAIDLYKHSSELPTIPIFFITLIIWVLYVGLVFFSFNTYSPEIRISVLDSVALLVIMALAIGVPSAPAGFGLFEAGVVAYLTRHSAVSNEAALAAASIFHLVITLPQLAVMVWLIFTQQTATLKESSTT